MKPKIHENYYDKSGKVVMIKTRHNDHDDKYILGSGNFLSFTTIKKVLQKSRNIRNRINK